MGQIWKVISNLSYFSHKKKPKIKEFQILWSIYHIINLQKNRSFWLLYRIQVFVVIILQHLSTQRSIVQWYCNLVCFSFWPFWGEEWGSKKEKMEGWKFGRPWSGPHRWVRNSTNEWQCSRIQNNTTSWFDVGFVGRKELCNVM